MQWQSLKLQGHTLTQQFHFWDFLLQQNLLTCKIIHVQTLSYNAVIAKVWKQSYLSVGARLICDIYTVGFGWSQESDRQSALKRKNSPDSSPQFAENILHLLKYALSGKIHRKQVTLVASGRKVGSQRESWERHLQTA